MKRNAQDSKSKILSNVKEAIPFAIPAIAGAEAASLVHSAAARRAHPTLIALRGRCFDHFPPIYYPPGTDITQPGADTTLFYLPQIGYVSHFLILLLSVLTMI